MNEMKESDWKILRHLVPTALDRLSKRILDEISRTSGQKSKTQHQRFLAAYNIMENGDNDMGRAFNDLRRSNATLRLTIMKAQGLITQAEFSKFSDETQQRVGVHEEAFK